MSPGLSVNVVFVQLTGLKCSSVPEEGDTRVIRGPNRLFWADTRPQTVHINSGTWNMVLSFLWTKTVFILLTFWTLLCVTSVRVEFKDS